MPGPVNHDPNHWVPRTIARWRGVALTQVKPSSTVLSWAETTAIVRISSNDHGAAISLTHERNYRLDELIAKLGDAREEQQPVRAPFVSAAINATDAERIHPLDNPYYLDSP